MIRPRLSVCLAASWITAASASAWPAELDVDDAADAIVRIRKALPSGWKTEDIRWDTAPMGWSGEPKCLLIPVIDESMRLTHDTGEFTYHPFYKLWLLPVGWEGRMEVAALDGGAPHAVYLGENESYRVLYRSLGVTSWSDGPEQLSGALGLEPYPLTHSPQHTLDIDAMQVLYRRLDTKPGAIERWQRQIYGIEELPELMYLELLTWDDRKEVEDPTFLGNLAERETEYLTREVMAAFPRKRGLYLRRVTRATFSDVLVVNDAAYVPSP